MDEIEQPPEEGGTVKRPRNRLLERAVSERWAIDRELRRTLIELMRQSLEDIQAGPTQVSTAAKTILAASKINLSNIGATIQADRHTDLERRVTELEQQLDVNQPKEPWTPSPPCPIYGKKGEDR